MNPIEFSKTIYLGDRYVKGILFDEKNKILKIKINEISRVRGKQWNYYNKENIVDGYIVFENVREYSFIPDNITTDDDFDEIEFKSVDFLDEKMFVFNLLLSYYKESGNKSGKTFFKIVASEMYLEDPTKLGVKIIN